MVRQEAQGTLIAITEDGHSQPAIADRSSVSADGPARRVHPAAAHELK